MREIKLIFQLLTLFCLLNSQAYAVEVMFTQNAQTNTFNNSYPQTSVLRDPFTPSRLMYEVIGSQSGLQNGAYGFIPNLHGAKVPKMKIRGFIDKDEDKPLALLEIEGSGTFMVREGDEINIDPSNPRRAIRISSITRLSVTVETGTLGSIRVLR